MTEHEYHRHLVKSADAFDREIDRYESILAKLRDVLRRQQVKVDNRRRRAGHAKSRFVDQTLLNEADIIERVLEAVRKAIA